MSTTWAATAERRRGGPSWWPDVAGSVVALSLLVVTGLWLSNRGLQDLTGGAASALSSVGRLTGLWAADLLLVQVLLIARIPGVEASFGQDRLIAWHRVVGFTSFSLMLAHVGLIVVGYAATEHSGVLAETWTLVTTYPGMLLALAAFALIVMVAITSTKAARGRLRYASWHLLHLYAYLGVGLAIPHQLWSGSDFNASPVSQAYWWTLYALTMGAVLAFRVVLPLWRSVYHRIRIAGVVEELPGVWSVYLTGHRLDRLGARAGQFFNWRFLGVPGWTRAHPYSLSAVPAGDQLRITVGASGHDSSRTGWLQPGTRVLVEGPYGRLTAEARTGRPVTLLGAGIGTTPLRALAEELAGDPAGVNLIVRSHDDHDLLFRDELVDLATRTGIRVVHLPGPRRRDGSWLPTGTPRLSDAAALRRLVPGIETHDVYVCGPDAWMDAVCTAVRRAGVPSDQLHAERFSW
jgi:predicted ferric reductase